MKVVKLHEWTPKQFLRPTLNTKQPNKAPKSLNSPKIKSYQMSELKETKKMKIIVLHEQTPKHISKLRVSLTTKVREEMPDLKGIVISLYKYTVAQQGSSTLVMIFQAQYHQQNFPQKEANLIGLFHRTRCCYNDLLKWHVPPKQIKEVIVSKILLFQLISVHIT